MTKNQLLCPQCGSSDLYYESGLVLGYIYHCKDCDYVGSFVIEVDDDDVESVRKDIRASADVSTQDSAVKNTHKSAEKNAHKSE